MCSCAIRRFYHTTRMHIADYAVARCPSVCLSHTPALCLNGYTYPHFFSTFGSPIILVFHTKRDGNIPTGDPLTGRRMQGGMEQSRFSTYIELYWTFVFWCLQHIYRVTLIGVFLGHFRINLHQTRTQYSSEGPQHWTAAQFPKIVF